MELFKKFKSILMSYVSIGGFYKHHKKAKNRIKNILMKFYGWSEDVADAVSTSAIRVYGGEQKIPATKDRYLLMAVIGLFSRIGFGESLHRKFSTLSVYASLISAIAVTLTLSVFCRLIIGYESNVFMCWFAAVVFVFFIAIAFLSIMLRVAGIIINWAHFGNNLNTEVNKLLDKDFDKNRKIGIATYRQRLMYVVFNMLPEVVLMWFLPSKKEMQEKFEIINKLVDGVLINPLFNKENPSDYQERWNVFPFNKDGTPIDGVLLASDISYSNNVNIFISNTYRTLTSFIVAFIINLAAINGAMLFTQSGGSKLLAIGGLSLIIVIYFCYARLFKASESTQNSPLRLRMLEARDSESNSPAINFRNTLGSEEHQLILKTKQTQLEAVKQQSNEPKVVLGKTTGIMARRFHPYAPVDAGRDFAMRLSDFDTHMMILGGTGSGKTQVLKKICHQILARHGQNLGALVLDGKNAVLPQVFKKVLGESMTLIDPVSTPLFNPIENALPHEISEAFSVTMSSESGKDAKDFFVLTPRALVEHSVIIMDYAKELKITIGYEDLEQILIDYKDKKISSAIAGPLANHDALQVIWSQFQSSLNPNGTLKRCVLSLFFICKSNAIAHIVSQKIKQAMASQSASQLIELKEKIKFNVWLSMSQRLENYLKNDGTDQNSGVDATLDNWFEMFLKYESLRPWFECEHGYQIEAATKGEMIGITVTQNDFDNAATFIARMAKKRLYRAIEERGALVDCPPEEKPVFLFVDEYQELVAKEDVKFVLQGRQFGMRMIVALQDKAGIESALGARAEELLTNIGSVIALKTKLASTKEGGGSSASTAAFVADRCDSGVQIDRTGFGSCGWFDDMTQTEQGATRKIFNTFSEALETGVNIDSRTLAHSHDHLQTKVKLGKFVTDAEVGTLTAPQFSAIAIVRNGNNLRCDVIDTTPEFF